jgi:Zn-dependent M28 family amino/carboxypeptidase
LGKQGEEIYNGADDDGSGTTSLLEIARIFSEASDKITDFPRRSIVFMWVSGEEKGLLGSKYYTEYPIYPLEETVVDLNIDMVGRRDTMHTPSDSSYIYLIGSDKLSSDLHSLSEQVNDIYSNYDLDYTYNDDQHPSRLYYRSDHYNFAKNNIPVIFYFGGMHEDYHQPTDEVEKIDFDILSGVTRLVMATSWHIANAEKRIEVDNPVKLVR